MDYALLRGKLSCAFILGLLKAKTDKKERWKLYFLETKQHKPARENSNDNDLLLIIIICYIIFHMNFCPFTWHKSWIQNTVIIIVRERQKSCLSLKISFDSLGRRKSLNTKSHINKMYEKKLGNCKTFLIFYNHAKKYISE